jgi:undecaprenyl diphosphate synthase
MHRPLLLFIALLCIPTAYQLYVSFHFPSHMEAAPIKHLGIIMDGNRRWAKKQQLLTEEGHKKGTETVKRLIQFCLERKIAMVSIYAFSLENFQRNPEEIRNIFKIMIEGAEKALPDLLKYGVRVRFIGDKNAFPENVRSTIEHVEKKTESGSKLQLNVLFCYGGRQEILCAVKDIIKDVKAGKLDDICEDAGVSEAEHTSSTVSPFRAYLWTAHLPDPDLIIRTGGFKRLSNFLVYQSTYSELYFTDRLWPDLTAKDLDEAVQDFVRRKRNFGT